MLLEYINTKNVLGSVRLRIYDEDIGFLEDYSRIMKMLEFNKA